MSFTLLKCLALLVSNVVLVSTLSAQQTPFQDHALEGPQPTTSLNGVAMVSLDIHVGGPNDTPMRNVAVVTLFSSAGEFYRQGTTNDGRLRFIDVAPAEEAPAVSNDRPADIGAGIHGVENQVRRGIALRAKQRCQIIAFEILILVVGLRSAVVRISARLHDGV